MDCSLPDSSVHGIFQAGILEWIVISFSRWFSWPRDQTHVSCISCTGAEFFTTSATWEISCWSMKRTNYQNLNFCLWDGIFHFKILSFNKNLFGTLQQAEHPANPWKYNVKLSWSSHFYEGDRHLPGNWGIEAWSPILVWDLPKGALETRMWMKVVLGKWSQETPVR